MDKNLLIRLFILSVFILQSCGKTEKKIIRLDESQFLDADTLVENFENEAKIERTTAEIVQELVNSWFVANANQDIGMLSELYDDNLVYYGKILSKNECLSDKINFFKQNPDFTQRLVSGIQTTIIDEGQIKCSFTKRVNFGGKTNDYPSYLIFVERNNDWRIKTEGDLITDSNLEKKKQSSNTKNYYFQPEFSTVKGVIRVEPGVDEFQNSKTKQIVLYVDQPIDVYPNTIDEEAIHQMSVYGISRIPLGFANFSKDLRQYVDKEVVVKGLFYKKVTEDLDGEVLLDVLEIK